MSNKEIQHQKLLDAKELVKKGVSRRRMDVILKQKYGESIGKASFGKLFGEKYTKVEKREAAKSRGYKVPKNTRQTRYNKLVNAHLLHPEAVQFSKLKSLKYNEIKRMVSERGMLWRVFLINATRKNWSSERINEEWNARIVRWYRQHKLVTKDNKPSPWEYFNRTSDSLPPEQQAGSPKRHKGVTQKRPTVKKLMVSKWINDLQKNIGETNDPERKKQLQQQIKNLQSQLKGGYEKKI